MSAPIVGARPGSSRAAEPLQGSLLDASVLLAACGRSEPFLERLCALLARMLPVELERATLALREGGATGLRHTAHQLSGMLAAFSTVAAAVASDLEEAAAREDLEAAGEHLDRLTSITDELLRQVGTVSVEALLRADAQLPDRSPPGY